MATAEIKDTDDEFLPRHKSPCLRRERIRGYKSIAFCDVTLEPLTVFVGRNGSGKSNLLDALAFLRDAVDISVREAVKRHGGWLSVAWLTLQMRAKDTGRAYKTRIDAAIFVQPMNLAECRTNSPSFDKLCREVEKRLPEKPTSASEPTKE